MTDLVFNKKAGFNYEITDTLSAGIELLGFEVKALRKKQGSLDGSYVLVRGGEAYLVGMQIPPFQMNNTPKEYDERRERRLLLTRQEIDSLTGHKSQMSLTAVPISVYNIGRKIKVKIGLAKSKKKFDKRENIKKRETDRDIRRDFKDR
ncbi:MAG TPA: SsrA-binding protein SmpB [Candidatus Nanoarchaeia archaeon]|nr:SsrA-binding protein SmpB [Candidatus Nanoarchaeia archaeon]